MLRTIFSILFIITSLTATAQLTVSNLKCERKRDPLGVESHQPLLSWLLESTGRNVNQTAYRILVASSPSNLDKNIGDVWDSQKKNSSESNLIKFSGKKLFPTKKYYWKVMSWDNHGNQSSWSKPATWQMGLLTKRDWSNAKWIAYEKIPDSMKSVLPIDGKKDTYTGSNVLPLLRKTFRVSKPIESATMYISGLGHFELNINGQKTGDHFLDPGWTKYDKQALYITFDVTSQLKQGENAMGVMLGNGFYYIPPVKQRFRKLKVAFGYPKLICRMLIEYKDGTKENIISDDSWKTTAGPITFSSIYGGEDYDANLEQRGWDNTGFNDASWKTPVIVDGPETLNAQMAYPLKVMQTFTPTKVVKVDPNITVYDLGQNASGFPQISVQGRKGDTIKIIPGELLGKEGKVSQQPTGSPYYFLYILKGDGNETWQPRFTYYGYRYLQVEAHSKSPGNIPIVHEIKSFHPRNAAEKIGTFETSNELFNRTFTLIDWAIKSNMVSVFSDCPHREKLGWNEQVHLNGNGVRYNYDIATLCRKNIHDMRYSQTEGGLVPEIAPEYVKFEWGGGIFRDSPEWGSNSIILPWYLYQWYGDKQVLEESYPMMKRYAAYLQTKANGYILKQGLGDWYDLGPKPPGVSQLTPMGVTGTAMYYYDLDILNKVATLLGKKKDAIQYAQLATRVKQAFNDTFFVKQTKQYATGSQTANAMAVYMNLVDSAHVDAVIENIVQDIRSRNNGLTAGDIGYRYLLRVLHKGGRSDVIYDMNSNPDVPGYGYQLAKGATALTESWEALPNVSNNHFMLGHIMEWFYRGLAGIDQSENSVAYKEIIIKPEPVGDITFTKATYKCVYGEVVSSWKKTGDRFTLQTKIPVNTTAVIYLPANETSLITESGNALTGHRDIQFLGLEKGRAKFKVGSGVYEFVSTGYATAEIKTTQPQ
jgi:alpha-L-rhamnosidase